MAAEVVWALFGPFPLRMGIRSTLDRDMLVVVTLVSFLVHIY